MVKQIAATIGIVMIFSSCTVFKSLNIPPNSGLAAAATPPPTRENRFIDNISVTPSLEEKTTAKAEKTVAPAKKGPAIVEPTLREESGPSASLYLDRNSISIEKASGVQLKYAILLNTEVEALPSSTLLENVDVWYGVRYRTGGNTKTGVDCSGFTVAVYAAVYGITLPRVSKDQYNNSRKISTTELREGDLVFFNTRGHGVSHVGIYLGNNHFIHASVSRGVMVSSLFEPYYLQRFVGAGRIDEKQVVARN